jgi:hypothetical protein
MKSPLSQSFLPAHSSLRSVGVDRFRLLWKGWSLKVLSLVVVVMVGGVSWGQVTICSDGLNNTSSLFTLSGGTYYTNSSGSGDRPASSSFASEGTHGYGINATSTSIATATLTTTNNVNTTGYSNISLSIKLAAFSISSTGNGFRSRL